MTVETILSDVLATLKRIHVIGGESGLMNGAIQNLQQVLNAIEYANEQEKAEGAKDAD